MELVLYLIRKELVTPAERMGYKNDIDTFSVYSYTRFYSRSFDPPLQFIHTSVVCYATWLFLYILGSLKTEAADCLETSASICPTSRRHIP